MSEKRVGQVHTSAKERNKNVHVKETGQKSKSLQMLFWRHITQEHKKIQI